MPRYVPEPTPTSDDLAELQRYIDVELRRISEAVNIKVDGAYAGLFQTDPFTFSPLTPTPELFAAFDIVVPERPDGVIGSPAQGSLLVLTPGNFMISFTTTVVNIPPNAEYGFLLALNGVSTGLGGVIEPSNQTSAVTVSFQIIFNVVKGDLVTMLINSVTSTDAEVINSQFMISRVSEEF